MAQINKRFSDLSHEELTFTDDFFKLKGGYIENEVFSYKGYDILKDVVDIKTNNFSNIAISKKQKNSDVLEVAKPDNKEKMIDIITTLSFFSNDSDSLSNPGAWLCFAKSYNTWDMDVDKGVFKITTGCPNSYSNYIFRLQSLDETTCQISHNFGDTTYYLQYKEGFSYLNNKDSETTKFLYRVDGALLRLYFKENGKIYKVRCKLVEGAYQLFLEELQFEDEGHSSDNIHIKRVETDFNYYIDSTWVKYDRSNKIDAIDNDRSAFNLDSQFLIHHEYSKSGSFNCVPLKNHLSYKGSLVNGSNLIKSSDLYPLQRPTVDFRTYTGLHTGINQERGNDTITLTFTFNDQEYTVEQGEKYDFTIPSVIEGELSPLYPYNSLNINDTTFVKNGAFGSDMPFFADKFRKLQNENTEFNTGLYLCTWLYQPSENAMPIWLDRYYYPDMVSRHKALKTEFKETFKPSFNNIPDSVYTKEKAEDLKLDDFNKEDIEAFKLALQNNTFVDKKSDVLIEPGTSYQYQRVSNNEVDELYNIISENRIDVVKDQKANNVNLHQSFAFNGENWRRIPGEYFNNTSGINFNANIYINPNKKLGLQLFGSDYNAGLNIQNRKDLAPFHYYASAEKIYLLNNYYQVRQESNISAKYGMSIREVIVGAPFEDLYILTDDSIIIMEYDLKLKSRILYRDIENLYQVTNSDENSIGDTISQYSAAVYNNNIFIPVNTKSNSYIVKIIFNPDKSEEVLTARVLGNNEYTNNFTNTYDETLVETEAIIKSIYIDSEGDIYAFNYDKLKMSFDGDTVYGIYSNKLNSGDNWYYIFNQSLGKLYTSASASKYAEFSSDISIDNIACNPLGEMAVIRGFRANATTNKFSNDEKALEIYSKTKAKVYMYPLKEFDEIISLDYYNYIDNSFTEQMVFVALGSIAGKITVVEYQSLYEKVKVHYTSLDADFLRNTSVCTNGNKLIKEYSENKIYFNLFLPRGVYNERLSIVWDLKDTQEGWYNINVEADTDEAIFRVKINDEIYKEINYKNTKSFQRFTHNNDSIFDGTYYIGCLGKEHGTRMHEILSDEPYDFYTLQNSKMENATLYNRVLKYHEYQANRLHFSKINPLTITLPCGVRNGIEEIVRYFRYRNPGFISNKVKINISGLGDIKLESELKALKKEILNAIEQHGDGLTDINDIEFI